MSNWLREPQIPGAEDVSYSHMGPLLPNEFKEQVSLPSASDSSAQAVTDIVGPRFFQLIGMRLLAGRGFELPVSKNFLKIMLDGLTQKTRPLPTKRGRFCQPLISGSAQEAS